MQDMDFLKSFHTAAQLLPERLWKAAYSLEEPQRRHCEELRIRIGRPLAATVGGETVFLGDGPVIPTKEELDRLLARATECSVHTYLEQLWQGFLTTRHGHRLGICSEAATEDVRLLRGLSSVNIRIARQMHGLGADLNICHAGRFRSTLILAAPGSGKTTLLRELCCRLSRDFRVAIADERYEIAACADGQPRFSIGSCDVLSGGHKGKTVPMLLRAMSPQILAVDEITRDEDCRVLLDCAGCGCELLATAHGGSVEDLFRRPAYRQLLEHRVFEQVILIEQTGCERRYSLHSLEEWL